MSIEEGEPEALPQHARLQRAVPRMSAEEHLERLRSDVAIIMEAQLLAWSDDAWLPLADALTEYGFGVVRGWLRSRKIFSVVKVGGYGGVPRCPDEWLDDDTIDELTGETVARSLHYFKNEVLMRNRWDATKGASLATYFIGQCKRQFADVYKPWHKDLSDQKETVPEAEVAKTISGGEDVAAAVVNNMTAEEWLARLSSPRARDVVRKKYLQELTYEEIAQTTPGVKDAKAAENIVSYEKKRLRRA